MPLVRQKVVPKLSPASQINLDRDGTQEKGQQEGQR